MDALLVICIFLLLTLIHHFTDSGLPMATRNKPSAMFTEMPNVSLHSTTE
jgi:hypothetical protein